MPKLLCPCGFAHDLSPIPDDGWVTVSDRDYEALVAAAADGRDGIPQVVALTGRLYLCPACGRLLWQQPGEERFTVFRPEPDAGPAAGADGGGGIIMPPGS